MSDDRKNIKIPKELFETLKEDKGKHNSWPQYLEDELTGDDSKTTKANGGLQSSDIEGIEAELDKLQELVERAPDKTADTLERELR